MSKRMLWLLTLFNFILFSHAYQFSVILQSETHNTPLSGALLFASMAVAIYLLSEKAENKQ